MGFSGSRTIEWCSTTVALLPRIVPPPSPPPPRPPPPAAPPPAVRVYVTVTSASTFSGNVLMCSINVREASTPVAPIRCRALNSCRSPVNSRVTSITGAPSLANAATGKD